MPQISPISWVFTIMFLILMMLFIKSNFPTILFPKMNKTTLKKFSKEMKW